MFETLPIESNTLRESGFFSDFDIQFTKFIYRQATVKTPELCWITLLLSRSSREGHVCLDLKTLTTTPLPETVPPLPESLSDREKVYDMLAHSGVAGKPGELYPFIIEGNYLYLQKFWHYEKTIADKLIAMASECIPVQDDKSFLTQLDKYFPQEKNEINRQRIAACIAATRRLCIITGGPGTGKTTTVVHILALLIEQSQKDNLRIALAAPTGKAAARMEEAVQQAKEKLPVISDKLPSSASTIHRLLGAIPHASKFRHNQDNPLPVDIVVIDEASMIDISLMYNFLTALPETAQLIILGDRDQLASVEAGSVLGDICAEKFLSSFSSEFLTPLKSFFSPESIESLRDDTMPALADSIVQLQKSFRFTGPIAECSNAVRTGTPKEAFSIITKVKETAFTWTELTSHRQIASLIRDDIINGWHDYLNADTMEEMFRAFNRFRTLCVLRAGPHGVESVNKTIELILAQNNMLSPTRKWYTKLPVMITRNDYRMQLYNGDTGIIYPDPDTGGQLKAWFPSLKDNPEQPFRAFSPSRLPAHEKAFAITVHKSQGAEFDSILLLLPDSDTPVLTRELLYTGITRARKQVHIYGKKDVFDAAVERVIDRRSGLRKKLWV